MREDVLALADFMMRAGQYLLERHEAVYPAGARMTIDGKIQMAAAAPGDEQPDPDALEALLVRGFQADARAGHVRAVGWFYTVDVSELPGGETSALKLCVEHADGEVAVVYVPFRRRRDGAAEYGELVRVAAQGRVFTPARS